MNFAMMSTTEGSPLCSPEMSDKRENGGHENSIFDVEIQSFTHDQLQDVVQSQSHCCLAPDVEILHHQLEDSVNNLHTSTLLDNRDHRENHECSKSTVDLERIGHLQTEDDVDSSSTMSDNRDNAYHKSSSLYIDRLRHLYLQDVGFESEVETTGSFEVLDQLDGDDDEVIRTTTMTSRETNQMAKPLRGTSIGLQTYASEITQHLLEAQQSVESLPSLHDSTSRIVSVTSGTQDRNTSCNASHTQLAIGDDSESATVSLDIYNRPTQFNNDDNRKYSVSVATDRKFSLNDTCSLSASTCRICLDGDVTGEPLVNPCLCTGTASHVHITCLKKWLLTSGNTVCELCQYELDIGWKSTSMWKALKDLTHVRMTNRRICWAVLVAIAALTLPLFCICIFVLDDENLRLQLSQPASMALSYGVILISCVAYLALIFMVAYLTWKWDFCPNPGRCHFPTEIEIRVESLEERLRRGRTRRNGYYRNTTPILQEISRNNARPLRRSDLVVDPYWMTGGTYI